LSSVADKVYDYIIVACHSPLVLWGSFFL